MAKGSANLKQPQQVPAIYKKSMAATPAAEKSTVSKDDDGFLYAPGTAEATSAAITDLMSKASGAS